MHLFSVGFSIFSTIAVAAPIVLIFFFVGVYVGSQIMHDGSSDTGAFDVKAYVNSNTDKFQATSGISRTAGSSVQALRGAIANLEQTNAANSVTTEIARNNNVIVPDKNSLRPPLKVSGVGNPPIIPPPPLILNPRSEPIKQAISVIKATDDEIFKLTLRNSLHITSESVYFAGPSDFDSGDGGILVSAYVYLDDNKDGDMRTVFTNKAGGCDKTNDQNGISLFINGWQTSDHQIYTEFGNSRSGCNKVHTEGLQLQMQKWYHLAVLHTDTDVVIYVDGKVIISKSLEALDTEGHSKQSSRKFMIGQFEGEEWLL